MRRIARFPYAAGALLVLAACQDRSAPTSPLQPPVMEIQDGHNGSNPHFFFLAPIRPFNLRPPKTAPFNPDLSPVVDICEWNGTACVKAISHLTMNSGGLLDRVFVLPQFEQYLVLWRTDQLHLDLTKMYRISVQVGTQLLGFADVDVVRTLREAARVDRDDFVPLLNNLILPIPFRIEKGALCVGDDCDSKSIDLSQGGTVVLATTGDRVDIPAQQSNRVVTISLRLCDGITADLPRFGNCLAITADPPLGDLQLSPRATISICSLGAIPNLIHAQQDLITLHRQDGELITALPHAPDFCPVRVGAAPLPPARNWVEAGWRAVQHNLTALFGARPLHAATALLDVGGGGETPTFSDFQFLLPAKMQITSGLAQIVAPHSAVPIPPSVLVTDAEDRPVGGARVHFHVISTTGGSITPTDGIVFSDPTTGRATLTEWRVGDVGEFSVDASGVGIASPDNNGPAEGFDPFAPAVMHDAKKDLAQAAVRVGTGRVRFAATVALADLTIHDLAFSPATPTNADAVTLSAIVTNGGGTGAASATVNLCAVQFFEGGNSASCLQPETPPLAAGQSATMTATFESFQPGTYTVYASVDTFEVVPESNEANNSATGPAFTVTAAPVTDLIACGGDPGGDEIDRGFYVSAYPGSILTRATLHLSARTAGTYTLQLDARGGTYDGTIFGLTTATVTLSANDQENVATTFEFGGTAVPKGSTLAFVLTKVDGPAGAQVFYSVPGPGDPACPVVQTNGTTAPLDSFRRQGVHITIEGSTPTSVIP